MKCRKCKTSNPAGLDFCRKCGAELGRDVAQGDGRRWLKALLLLLVMIWAGYFFKGMLFPFHSTENKNVVEKKIVKPIVEEEESSVPGRYPGKEEKVTASPFLSSRKGAGKKTALPVGWVTIYDLWDNEIASVDTLVVDGSWVALPVRACLGGARWVFRLSNTGEPFEIDGGRWVAGDEVALWHLAQFPEIESPVLAAWQSRDESHWRSLVSLRASADLGLNPDWQQGFFLHATVAMPITESGVILQHDKITGWTFGEWLDGAYLWQQQAANSHAVEVTVDAFYAVTFAGGREEQFASALALGEGTVTIERLQMFLDGFQLPPKLDLEDVPESLYPENILDEVRGLAWELRQQGILDRLVQLVDGDMVKTVADFALLKIVVGARVATGGYGRALDLVEEVVGFFELSEDFADVRALQLKLYQLWLADLLLEGDYETAWLVLDKGSAGFAEDPELHLVRVSLVLGRGDWQMAEELLGEREYPAFLSGQVRELAARISESKGREEKVVVHFSPGSNYIPVKVVVNGTDEFPFLVDTGASLVSLPLSFLPVLGIEIDTYTPRRKVVTASGTQEAWLVTLDAVELGGWVVNNLEAVVVDTGGQNDFGLLGLNFLSKFHMQLDSNKGVLILTPR